MDNQKIITVTIFKTQTITPVLEKYISTTGVITKSVTVTGVLNGFNVSMYILLSDLYPLTLTSLYTRSMAQMYFKIV